jgi:hypothetical protein
LVDVFQVAKQMVIERERRLPLAGRVLVSVGDAVQPDDVIAEALLPSGVIILDIAQGLGVPVEDAGDCLQRQPGEMVGTGDLLAQFEGRLTRAIRAPADGLLVDFSRGKMTLAATEAKVTVTAGMSGEVTDVIPEFGATLRAEGGLIQGEWGNGGNCEGPLKVIEALEADEELTAPDLTAGEILVLPAVSDGIVFDWVREKNLAGLVTFWLAPTLLAEAKALNVPVLVISGLGAGSVDPVAWALLTERAGERGCLTAENLGIGRPELILQGEAKKPEKALGLQAALAVGQRVRILTGDATGLVGLVTQLEAPLLFESGFSFPAATIVLVDGNQVQVPQQNLVILGE